MDARFKNLVNDTEFVACVLQATVEEDLDTEGDAIETEGGLLATMGLVSKNSGPGIDCLMGNLAEASKEVVVPKTLQAYGQYARFLLILDR
jgi:hypothetical protein